MNNEAVTFRGAHSERAEPGRHEVEIGTDQHKEKNARVRREREVTSGSDQTCLAGRMFSLCVWNVLLSVLHCLTPRRPLWAPFPALHSSPVLLPSGSYQVGNPDSGDHTCQGDYLIHSVSHVANS